MFCETIVFKWNRVVPCSVLKPVLLTYAQIVVILGCSVRVLG